MGHMTWFHDVIRGVRLHYSAPENALQSTAMGLILR
jgi:hypothetical protein